MLIDSGDLGSATSRPSYLRLRCWYLQPGRKTQGNAQTCRCWPSLISSAKAGTPPYKYTMRLWWFYDCTTRFQQQWPMIWEAGYIPLILHGVWCSDMRLEFCEEFYDGWLVHICIVYWLMITITINSTTTIWISSIFLLSRIIGGTLHVSICSRLVYANGTLSSDS